MPERRQSYEGFKSKIKAKYKKQKFQRKDTTRSLRQIHYIPLVQSSPEPNDDERAQQKDKEKAKKWWAKQNRYYFKYFDQDSLNNYIQFTTSSQIVGYGCQTSTLYPYYQSVLEAQYPSIFPDYGLRILFRNPGTKQQKPFYSLVCYYCPFDLKDFRMDEWMSIRKEKRELHQQINKKENPLWMETFHPEETQYIKIDGYSSQQLDNFVDESMIIFNGACDDENFIQKALIYEKIWRSTDLTEVEKEQWCWLQELQEQHAINMQRWREIEQKVAEENRLYPLRQHTQQEINQLKKSLVRGQIYLYFRSGYEDKTKQDLQKASDYLKDVNQWSEEGQYRLKNDSNPKFIETDCKICFCTKNQINNKVIYCDQCNTSFHHGCYGISKPILQHQPFMCDVCQYVKKNSSSTNKNQRPSCQICGISRFPRKNIDNHFYHVSCLVLFNFADVKDFQVKLKKNITHQTIMNQVIENELQNQYCEFCHNKSGCLGMKFRCTGSLCAKSYHPICAYLYGCIFTINPTSKGNMMVQVQCRQHFEKKKKQLFEQVYTRRFFCNFKTTYKMSFQKFSELYEEELRKNEKFIAANSEREKGIRKILKQTKKLMNMLERSDKDKRKKEQNSTQTSALLREVQKKMSQTQKKSDKA